MERIGLVTGRLGNGREERDREDRDMEEGEGFRR